jgi:hypothetical protein
VQLTAEGAQVTRTKMFFGARYLWTAAQLAAPGAARARGIRLDVARPPGFCVDTVLPALLARGAASGPHNQVALNVYETGGEGLAPHFDDAERFALPVSSLRLFSDSRLSFGCRGSWGASNGAFAVPMPRGAVLVLHEGSFAATAVKHSVRSVDMRGRSGVILFRRIHEHLLREAFDIELDQVREELGRALDLDEDGRVRREVRLVLEHVLHNLEVPLAGEVAQAAEGCAGGPGEGRF